MRWSTALMMLFTAACATSTPRAVPVTASAADAHLLSGRWSGSYAGTSTGRHGSIVFTLEGDSSTAHGDVVMLAQDRNNQPTEQPPRIGAPIVQPLNIQFVVLSGHQVSGMLDPYDDPECHCRVSTTFVGVVDGDRIDGQFVTWGGATSGPQRGTWSVRREAR